MRNNLCYKHFLIGTLLVFFALPATTSAISHPSLLFYDITETPGYQHRTESPWKGWEQSIISSANNNLSRDFSDPSWSSYNRIGYRADFAQGLALAYQITNEDKSEIAKMPNKVTKKGTMQTGGL